MKGPFGDSAKVSQQISGLLATLAACFSPIKKAGLQFRDDMTDLGKGFVTATLIVALAAWTRAAWAQATPDVTPGVGRGVPSLKPLLDFSYSEIKFNLQGLMNVLRDRNHEGWLLAAYPDPNTELPLIGAGFSLTVAASDHPQRDPLNPNQFLEPSSAQLWQAAGLDPEQLREILEEFNRNMDTWGVKGYRRRIRAHSLRPQLTEMAASQLLRITAIQAIVNARAYCRNFDRLTGPAQMALSQLAFQMGTNLEQFVEFLSELNGDTSHPDLSQPGGGIVTEAEHWKHVQKALIDSQWARRYTVRAITVIAMFDPEYAVNPRAAEARVMALLPPPVPHRRGHAGARRAGSPKAHSHPHAKQGSGRTPAA